MKWSEKSLDELGFVGRGKSKHRPRDAAHLYGGDYPFIQTGDVKHSDLYVTKYTQTYSEAGLAQSKLWKKGTLCITIAANIADTAILGIDACFPDSVIGFIANEDECNVLYIKYLFHTLQKNYQQYSQGAAQDNLSQKKLLSLKFPVPPLNTQNKIASILSAYDELIENNNRRIALLEESARLLYREWFVSLRFPGHENTKIINGVPEGWEETQLGDHIKIAHGCAFKGAHFSDTETKLILLTPGNFKVGGGIKFDKLKFYSKDGPLEERYILNREDLLVTMTDLSKMSDTLGFPMFVPDHSKYTFLHNQRLGKVESIGTFFPKYFFYCLFQDYRYRSHVVGSASGVAVKHTSPTKILSFNITLPQIQAGGLIDDFNKIIQDSFIQVELLMRMNQSAKKARDLLLPKLMNGEIPV